MCHFFSISNEHLPDNILISSGASCPNPPDLQERLKLGNTMFVLIDNDNYYMYVHNNHWLHQSETVK